MLVYAERLPSPPAELSATVRIAAKLTEKLEAVVDDYFAAAPSVSTTGRSSRLCCKSASTRDSHTS